MGKNALETVECGIPRCCRVAYLSHGIRGRNATSSYLRLSAFIGGSALGLRSFFKVKDPVGARMLPTDFDNGDEVKVTGEI
jgi:hypothetical protein